MGALSDLRVLELGEMVSAAYAGRLLADLGADVVKVEPPGGDRARARGPFRGEPDAECSGLHLYLNAGKRSIVLDPTISADRATLDGLAARSDAVLHNLPPAEAEVWDLSWPRLKALRPSLVLCSITPFGAKGLRADLRSEEITRTNAGGWCWLSPGALEDPSLPPLKPFGHQTDFQAALAGAAACLSAVYGARRTGRGEFIDLSVQEAVAAILEVGLIGFTYMEHVATRLGVRGLQPWGMFECADGLIFLSVIEPDQWERLVEFMGRPEWAGLEIFADFPSRMKNADVLHVYVQDWTRTRKVEELFHEGQGQRICFAPVLDMAGVAGAEHLRERGFFHAVDHPRVGRVRLPGPPFRLREGACAVRGPAPLLDQHGAELRAEIVSPRAEQSSARSDAARAERPLEGIRVADFSWVWAGPFGAMQLAHLGAEVIKLESAARPDVGRRLAVFQPGVEPGLNRSGYFNQWNQGKKSVLLNLAHAGAPALARRLVAECDVVIENFATGVMDRLGLGYEALHAVNPRLVYASISGYGSSGPLKSYMGYGPAMGPLSGLSAATGYPGGGPRELGISLGDPTAGMTAVVAIAAALIERERTGEGQLLDISLWESTAAVAAEAWLEFELTGRPPERRGNRDSLMTPHGLFPCAGEDAWVAIACAGEKEWTGLCAVVDPALAGDARFASAAERKANEDALEERIAAWTRERDRWEVTERLQAAGVAAFPSLTPEDLAGDPHLRERGFLEQLDHPEVGAAVHAGIPWRLAEASNGVRSAAPLLGQDTDQVLGGLLGLSEAEIAAARADGLVA